MRGRAVLRYVSWALAVIIVSAIGLGAGVYLSLSGGSVTIPIVNRTINMTGGPPPFGGKDQFVVLVLGLDQKERNNSHSPQRSDTIILLSVDLKNRKIQGLSIPRDTLTEIPGRRHPDKLNAAYAFGYAPLSIQAVSNLTGVTPDYYVVTDVGGFQKMVDLLGGVDIYVEKDMHYDDNWQDLHIHLKKGYQRLNGEQAMGYVRFRHDRLGDVGRIHRQQEFLKAVARRMLVVSNWPKLPQIIRQARSVVVDTNLLTSDLIHLAKAMRGITEDSIHLETLPGKPQTIHGVSYWIPDEQKSREVIASIFGATDQNVAATVEVLNGAGRRGVATEVARALEQNGFRVVRVANADSYSYSSSLVIFRPQNQEGAREIANFLGTNDVRPAPKTSVGGTDITVIVGKDYQQEGQL
ncbi:MAG: LCP family protein [Armatimonadota bacterium]